MEQNSFDFYSENKEVIDEILDVVIENHPDIISARESKNNLALKEAFDEFYTEFPNEGIATVDEFDKMENYDDFIGFIEKGLSFNEAYKLCNFSKLIEKSNLKGSDEQLMKISSKEHLKPTGKGTVYENSVPKDVYNLYKALVKDWSDEKIRKHFNNNK